MITEYDNTTRTVTTRDATTGAIISTRPFTAEENAAADAQAAQAILDANAAQLAADTAADLAKVTQSIADLAALLGDDATTGSIRNLVGPSGATAGTTSLRALAAQSNTAVVTAASVKALIRINIDLAQLTIADVTATRRVARQVLRLAKVLAGDYGSTDVGVESALKAQ